MRHAFRSKPISELLAWTCSTPPGAFSHSSRAASVVRPRSRLNRRLRQCEAIAQLLRPDFEISRTPSDLRRERDDELTRFTEEQFAGPRRDGSERAGGVSKDRLEQGRPCLAIEAAQRAASGEAHVLLLVFQPNARRLVARRETPHSRRAVTTQTLHSYMLGVADIHPPAGKQLEFLLGIRASSARCRPDPRGRMSVEQFDELIVDEAQDILRDEYLDVLDLSVARRAGSGPVADLWRLRTPVDLTVPRPSRSMSSASAGAVTQRDFISANNCRNAPRIVEFIKLLARLDSGYSRVLRPDSGSDPRIKFQAAPEARVRAARARHSPSCTTTALQDHDIVVLSTQASGSCSERLTERPWSDRLAPARDAGPGQIPYTSIHAFKGMEAAAVVGHRPARGRGSTDGEPILRRDHSCDRPARPADGRIHAQLILHACSTNRTE